MGISDYVVKLEVGDESANAVLIDSTRAITLKHCVQNNINEDQEIKIYKDGRAVQASVETMTEENDGYVILTLQERIDITPLTLVDYSPTKPFEPAAALGFDNAHNECAIWRKLESVGQKQSTNISDLTYNLKDTTTTVSGLSGSPILRESVYNEIYGLISQENMSGDRLIDIKGISIVSQKEFLQANNVNVQSPRQLECPIDIKKEQKGFECIDTTFSISNIELVQPNNPLYDYKFKEIIILIKKGNLDQALINLKDDISILNNCADVSAQIKAKYYYQYALLLLEYKKKTKASQRMLKKALEYDQNIDVRIYNAIKADYEQSQNALGYLDPIDSIYILNTYLQICINNNQCKKALDVFEEYNEEYDADESTLYLVSVAYLKLGSFEKSLSYIEQAIQKNGDAPEYYLVKGLISYWRIRKNIHFPISNIYPLFYMNSLVILSKNEEKNIEASVAEFKKAYKHAYENGNKQYKEMVLTTWLAVLSLCTKFHIMSNEPKNALAEENPYHIAVLLNRLSQKDTNFSEHDILEIKNQLKTCDDNLVPYILVLEQIYKTKGKYDEAKSLLYEYKEAFLRYNKMYFWYANLAVLIEKQQKRKILIEIIEDDSIQDIEKRRLKCVYESDREIIFKNVKETFEFTKDSIDLIALVQLCSVQKKWEEQLEYARLMRNKYHYSIGVIYEVEALLRLKKYDDALKVIDENLEIQELHNQLNEYKMKALHLKGELKTSYEVGKQVLASQMNEKNVHEMVDLCLALGNQSEAIQYLEECEKKHGLSSSGYKRLSELNIISDTEKSYMYAERARSKDRSQNTSLWFMNQMAKIGKSDKMNEILEKELNLKADIPGVQIMNIEQIKSLMIQNMKKAEELNNSFLEGQIPIHDLLDKTNNTFCYYFYNKFSSEEGVFGDLLEVKQSNHMDLDTIVLDITSCVLLSELGLLKILSEKRKIKIADTFLPLLEKECTELVPNQIDLYNKRQKVLNECLNNDNIDIESIKSKNDYNKDYLNHVIYVSDDSTKNANYNSNDVIRFYEEGNLLKVLKGQIILTDFLVVCEWYDHDLLEEISDQVKIMISYDGIEMVKKEGRQIENQKEVIRKIKKLISQLKELIDNNKITFFNVSNDGMTYDELLFSELEYSVSNRYMLCVDDRWTKGIAANTCDRLFISTKDVVQALYEMKCIKYDKYKRNIRKLIQKKFFFILPNENYFQVCFDEKKYEDNEYIEGAKLYELRKYINWACNYLSMLERKVIGNNLISEEEVLQSKLILIMGGILKETWNNAWVYEHKCMISDWILMNISRMGSEIDNEKNGILTELTLVQLFWTSMQLSFEKCTSRDYNKWLFGELGVLINGKNSFYKKSIDKVINTILDQINDIELLQDPVKSEILKTMIAQAINSFPFQLKEEFLKNSQIKEICDKGLQKVICITNNIYFLEKEWKEFEDNILQQTEGKEIKIVHHQKELTVFWKNIHEILPVIKIKDDDKMVAVYCTYFARTKNSNREVKKEEYKRLLNLIGDKNNLKELNYGTKTEEISENSFKRMSDCINQSELCVECIAKSCIEQRLLFINGFERYCLPLTTAYFKEIYDSERDGNIISGIGAFPGGLITQKPQNYNPVKYFNYFNYQISKNSETVHNTLEHLFQFLGKTPENIYGSLFSLMLKIVKDNFDLVYPCESQMNKIVWSYIWTDKLMTIITQMELDESKIEEVYQEIIHSDKGNQEIQFLNKKTVEYLNPSDLSIYRVAFIWPLKVLSDYKENYQEEIVWLFENVSENFMEIIKDRLNLRDIYFSNYINRNNSFNTKFYVEDINILVYEEQAFFDNGLEEKVYSEYLSKKFNDLLNADILDKGNLNLLKVLIAQKLNSFNIKQLEEIIEKHCMSGIHLNDRIFYQIISPVLDQLHPEFLKEYQKSEYKKLKEAFLENPDDWKKWMEIAELLIGEEVEPMLAFLEELYLELKEPMSFSFLKYCFKFQLELNQNDAERMYKIRTNFALK